MPQGEERGGIVNKPRSTNASDREGSRIFEAEHRPSEQGGSAIPGSKATKALLLRSPAAQREHVLTRRVNFPTVQVAKRDASRSAGKEGNEATVD